MGYTERVIPCPPGAIGLFPLPCCEYRCEYGCDYRAKQAPCMDEKPARTCPGPRLGPNRIKEIIVYGPQADLPGYGSLGRSIMATITVSEGWQTVQSMAKCHSYYRVIGLLCSARQDFYRLSQENCSNPTHSVAYLYVHIITKGLR